MKHVMMGAHTFTTNAQQEWDTKTKELYAVWRLVKDWQHILRGRPFIIHTDHANLTNYGADPTSVQRRQLRFIDEFDYELHWIPGEKHCPRQPIQDIRKCRKHSHRFTTSNDTK